MPTTRSGEVVEVEGLKELIAGLKQAEVKVAGEMGKASKEAGDVVIKAARTVAAQKGGAAAKAAPSLVAAARAREAAVSYGSDRYPMAMGAEFGAKQYPQFEPFRGNQWEGDGGPGYVLQPTIKAKRPEFETVYLAGIDRVTHQAFPNR